MTMMLMILLPQLTLGARLLSVQEMLHIVTLAFIYSVAHSHLPL